MIYCNVKPEKINFRYSNVIKISIEGVTYAHRKAHGLALKNYTHEEILNYYKKRNEIDPTRYRHIHHISIGEVNNKDWIEEGYYKFPR